MTDWKKIYEEFIAEKRRMTRAGMLSSSAILAGGYLGGVLDELHEFGETPELMNRLSRAYAEFQYSLGPPPPVRVDTKLLLDT